MKFIDIQFNVRGGYKVYAGGKEVIECYNFNKIQIKNLLSQCGYKRGKGVIPAKDFYKDFLITPKQLVNYVNKAVYKATVASLPKEVQTLCFNGKILKTNLVLNICQQYDLVIETLEDGNRNILPFVVTEKASAQELKKKYGKGLWKKICNQKFTRNRYIASMKLSKESLEKIMEIPSGIIMKNNSQSDVHLNIYNWIHKNCGVLIKDSNYKNTKVQKDFRLVEDTYRMAQELEKTFSFQWSLLKMKNKHEEYTKEVQNKEREKLAKENKKYLGKIREGKINKFEFEDAKAELLDEYLKILDEGRNMHHCVGMYAKESFEGRYLVFHLTGDDEETTLGIYINEDSDGIFSYSIQQHYGIQNQQVKSEKHKKLAEKIEYELNLEGKQNEI